MTSGKALLDITIPSVPDGQNTLDETIYNTVRSAGNATVKKRLTTMQKRDRLSGVTAQAAPSTPPIQ
ncbi:hypothetical protein [Mesorhizobium sp. CO1-1-8]|uniref:hypothetical protein n=1 Tax=Mesorhizobium sp. CO1-1-8 TaxID=2876631 RepID=UPI001CD0921A|nr:hypothetical protein [Mesorhizobium sp. CO1-1-8]MBZ9775444.1 hypothetical protein [Mesorhizobium sp. CO1-1-8]